MAAFLVNFMNSVLTKDISQSFYRSEQHFLVLCFDRSQPL
ncbi:hypothetical protein DSUL_20384 [Desulfovibrionales bacterium]